MKSAFYHRLINGQYEDPSLYVRMLRERRAFLFDIGFIGNLKPADLQKVTNVFVSHMHIDHFMGFDLLLRVLLGRDTALHVWGPEGIIECVEGKLRGYTWNVIKEYPAKIEVSGIGGTKVRQASFYAENNFERIDRDTNDFKGVILEDSGLRIRAVSLFHGIQCLGFSLEEDLHINIDKAALTGMGLHVGPWLSRFKALLRGNASADTRIRVDDKDYKISDLAHIARATKGQKVSYITDISPVDANIKKAIDLAVGSDTLYCEAYFLHGDLDKAFERHHLTARLAGEIAGKAGVNKLITMHFSPRYRHNPDAIEKEARDAFLTRINEPKIL